MTTYYPVLNLIGFNASASYVLSYGSISYKISIYFNRFSYPSLFFYAAPLTIWLKQSLSNEYNNESVFEIIVAALGALYNKANSPKLSPG